MFHYFHDIGVKKNKFIIRTTDNKSYMYESTIIEPIYVFKSIKRNNEEVIEVEDWEGWKVAISIMYIVSIEKYVNYRRINK